ncbi:c-type cytochrome [Aurantiacibacter sp. MUD11]|uniref:c-type cytochrome n=1 Tax=Aurantiacibacter sp. MUD11 TaxID=3003265 RepID=UPI0022AA7E3D|nr:c-type cytochrome [Aurantiacibacter sp. MUD11]WAT18900.1 c-type cytochrome [Aurantiacibacter sp. MUD11]
MAFPLYSVAQEHDHSAHAGHDEAAAAEVAPLTEAEIESSRALFSQYSCGACHVLGDAGGNGHIGPALDGNAALSVEYVTQIISNGQGAMPSFGGMVSEEEIETLSRYIVEKKAD